MRTFILVTIAAGSLWLTQTSGTDEPQKGADPESPSSAKLGAFVSAGSAPDLLTDTGDEATGHFSVSVAIVRSNWSETLDANPGFADELTALYEDLDLNGLGGMLGELASELLFPSSHATVFSVSDMAKIQARLANLDLWKTIPVTAANPVTIGRTTFDTFTIPEEFIAFGLRGRHKNPGPFAKRTFSLKLSVGADSRRDGTVLCDRQYLQFIDTEWPVRTKHVERNLETSVHFGNSFDLDSGQVGVVRLMTQRIEDAGLSIEFNRKESGTPAESTASIGGPFSAATQIADATDDSTDTDAWIPIILITEKAPSMDLAVTPGLARPLKTATLSDFDYNNFVRASRFRWGIGDSGGSTTQRTVASIESAIASNPAKESEHGFRVFYLKNAGAAEAVVLLDQLFSDSSGIKVVPDERTNALFVLGSGEELTELEAVLKVLDSDRPAQSDQVTSGTGSDAVMNGQQASDPFSQVQADDSIQQLVGQSQQLQNRALARAWQYLQSESQDSDLSALRETVKQDFEVRQQLQLTEIQFLKARLVDLERRVKQKEQLKDRIIDRRVESLLSTPTMPPKASAEVQDFSEPVPSPNTAAGQLRPSFTPGKAERPAQSPQQLPSTGAAVSRISGLENTGLIRLRPDEILDAITEVERTINAGRTKLAFFKRIKDDLNMNDAAFDLKVSERKLALLSSQLEQQIQSLHGFRDSTRASLDTHVAMLETVKSQYQKGFLPTADVLAAEARVKETRARISEIEALLNLYLQVRDATIADQPMPSAGSDPGFQKPRADIAVDSLEEAPSEIPDPESSTPNLSEPDDLDPEIDEPQIRNPMLN